MRLFAYVLLLATLLPACSGGEPTPSGASAAASAVASLPATVEGMLVADVSEGDVDDAGYSDINFGTLTVGSEDLLVQVDGSLLKSAGVPDTGARVRATLGSKTEQYAAVTYTITALERL